MKKVFLIILLLTIVTGVWSTPKDLIVLLDTSKSMTGEFKSTVTYLVEDIMRNYIQIGDSFRMLLFDSYTTVDLEKNINSGNDAADIINHLDLVVPLFGEYTDLIEALDTLYTYTDSISDQNEKRIVILTDGRHDPPPGKYPKDFDHKAEIDRLTKRLTEKDWAISIVPLDGGKTAEQELTSENSGDFFTEDMTDAQQLAEQLGADIVNPSTEEGQMRIMGQIQLKLLKNNLSSKDQKVRLKFEAVNYRNEPVEVNILGVLYKSADVLDSSVSVPLEPDAVDTFSLVLDFGGALTENNTLYPVSLFIRNENVKPTSFELAISYTPLSFVRHILPVILIILAIIAVIIIIILAVRSGGRLSRRGRDEERTDYSLLGLKKDTKQQQTKQRITPYDEKAGSVKGTKYYPDDRKSAKKVGKGPESTIALSAAKPAAGGGKIW